MKRPIASLLVVTATLLAGGVAAAPKQAKQIVKIDRLALVGASVLPAGTYQLELVAGGDTAKFVQQDRTVAEVHCKIGFAEVVYPGNAVHYRDGEGGPDRLIKIVLESPKLSIAFPTDPDGARSAL